MTAFPTDQVRAFHQVRMRRQILASDVRRAIDDLTRTTVQSRHQKDKEHELQLLREALSALGRRSMPSADERASHREIDVLEKSLKSFQ